MYLNKPHGKISNKQHSLKVTLLTQIVAGISSLLVFEQLEEKKQNHSSYPTLSNQLMRKGMVQIISKIANKEKK
jgi:hypothetical protein